MSSMVFWKSTAQPTSIFLEVSRRGQLKSRSVSQFGLPPHFRQVPVGIYNTLKTRSSLSTALTLNASTTYLTDMFFKIILSPAISQTVAYSKLDNTVQNSSALKYYFITLADNILGFQATASLLRTQCCIQMLGLFSWTSL